jgi:CubicO group peptidase (beta-lactamase class C family)
MMKILFFFLLFVLHCHLVGLDSLSKSEKICALMEAFEPEVLKAMEEYQVPGVSIGIVVGGELVYAKGFGWRDLENRLPANAETVYRIGSCSKAFTSFLAGTLVDQGLMQWDQRIIDIYPEFRMMSDYATLNLTLRDLLSHRSGMPKHDLMWYNSPTLTRTDVMQRLRFLEPSSEIRERYQYSNLMFLAAGVSMEHLMSSTWEELVSERITHPIGMKHTSFTIGDMHKEKDYALPYIDRKGGAKRMAFRDISLIGPAGGMNSNVIDLAKWLQVQMNGGIAGGKSLIRSSTLKEMHTPQMIIVGALESNDLIMSSTGLGWNVVSYRGLRYICHDGGIDGFTSMIGFFPKEEIGTIILTNKNVSSLPRYLSTQIGDRLFDLPPIDWLKDAIEILDQEPDRNGDVGRKKGTNPMHPLIEYEGEYFNEGYGEVSIQEKNGKLSLFLNDLEFSLEHWHYDVFRISEEHQDMSRPLLGIKLSFQNGANGEVATVSAPLEAHANEIVFQRRASASKAAFLQQFIGTYVAYSYAVEVTVSQGILYATIPGSPPYELIPVGENEFTAKSLSGYTVRFITGLDGGIEEAMLIHPYGILSAKKIRNQP